ncbi:MAG TPA: DUF4124 domain-containing protein [Burkholderiales bacterium]
MVHQIAFFFLFSLSLAAHGADVFGWVDEDGKVHYGDTVPERYKQKAKKLQGADVTSAQRQEAQARLAREQARVESLRRAREAKSDEAQPNTVPSPDIARAGDNTNTCEEQLKKYLDSQTCFAPYVIKGGAVKPEAFQNCTEVKEPRGCWQKPAPSDRN